MTTRRITTHEVSRLARRLYRGGPAGLRYRQWFRIRICPFEAVLEQVPRGATVLDVGCGGGLLLGLLATTGRLGQGVGFDLDPHAIATAAAMRDRLDEDAGDIEFETRAAGDPWPEGQFDVVTIVDVLHHLPEDLRPAVIAMAAEHLKPGGRLVCKDMRERPRWRALANRLHDLVLARQWVREPSGTDVETWARTAGLRLTHHETMDRWWYGHVLWVFAPE